MNLNFIDTKIYRHYDAPIVILGSNEFKQVCTPYNCHYHQNVDHFHHPKSSLMLICNQFLSLSFAQGNHWFAFQHYGLKLPFLEFLFSNFSLIVHGNRIEFAYWPCIMTYCQIIILVPISYFLHNKLSKWREFYFFLFNLYAFP